ncbi:SdpI family protein [uncultured Allobaculum sp.]|uniref:SdpI family protein n=1 Tax=uncultured Allobaculum sp. TaxID=1187017 RepID=UPI00259BDFDD|nr:SdpI family protein [uncultured Allobaculum sp.]
MELRSSSKKGSAQSPSIENLLLLTIPFIELIVYIGILLFMNTDAFRITTWISGLIGLLLVILGNLMPKARQNSYFGFRTQSTLSSKSVWQKTNRAAGYALTLLGVLTIFAAFTYNEVLMFALLIGGSLLVTMGLSIYAHRLADRESQKTE